MASTNESGWFNWRNGKIAAVGIGIAFGMYQVYRYYCELEDEQKMKVESKKSKPKKGKKLTEDEISELKDKIDNALANLQNDQNYSVSEDDHDTLDRITAVNNFDNWGAQDRTRAAQFMIMCFTKLAQALQSDNEVREFIKRQKKDSETTWKLLNLGQDKFTENAEYKNSLLLRLDIATRLHDAKRLVPCYNELMKFQSEFQDEEMVVAFTIAPVLGRWKDVFNLGNKLKENNRQPLEVFHQASIARPDIPDYEVLYEMSKEEDEKFGPHPTDQLIWKNYVASAQMKYKSPKPKTGQNNDEDSKKGHVSRNGAIAQLIFGGSNSIDLLLVGSATSSRMKFKMYDKASRKLTYHTIEVTSKDPATSPTRNWQGSYTITISDLKKDKEPVEESRVVYDFTMTLTEDPTALDL